MEIMKNYIVLAASVILFVLVTSANGDTTGNDTAVAGSEINTEEVNATDRHQNGSNFIQSVLENLLAANLINILPHPIQTVQSLIKEITTFRNVLGPKLPQLLLNPIALAITAFPHLVALVLIVLTILPVSILPAKFIALFFSVLGMFTQYFSLFDKEYLSGL
jgi:hypothetical protein